MKLSKLVTNISPSPTLELVGKIAELRRQGQNIIGFNLGEPDFGTPENICMAAIGALTAQKTKYTPIPGIMELREAVCEKMLRDHGLEYKPTEVCVGTGAKQPLADCVFALCEDGDEVLIPTPCYVSYVEMVKLAGAKPVMVENLEEEGFALNIKAIKAAITPRTRAIIINTPNNPTGAVYTEEALSQLVDLAVKHDFMIISDEVYEKLLYNGKKHTCVASVSAQAKEHSVIINGMSKAYSMTGWRIGYAVGPLPLIKAITALQGHATSNTCSITQYAALEALKGPQDAVEDMRQEFDRRRKFLVKRLNEMDGVTCVDADGAFYLMPNISSFFGKQTPDGKIIKDSMDVASYILEDAKVAVVPGAAFEAPNNLRISYSNSMENLEKGMNLMEEALRKLS